MNINHYKSIIIWILVVSFLMYICKFINTRSNELWVGKQLNIDTIYKHYKLEEFIDTNRWQVSYKLITFVDSNGCFDCNLKLEAWKNLLVHIDSISSKN